MLIMLFLCAIVFMFSIPLILKLRNYLYKKNNLTIGWYEDYLFIIGLIVALTFHSMITGSELSAILTSGPFTYGNFRIYKHYWKRG